MPAAHSQMEKRTARTTRRRDVLTNENRSEPQKPEKKKKADLRIHDEVCKVRLASRHAPSARFFYLPFGSFGTGRRIYVVRTRAKTPLGRFGTRVMRECVS